VAVVVFAVRGRRASATFGVDARAATRFRRHAPVERLVSADLTTAGRADWAEGRTEANRPPAPGPRSVRCACLPARRLHGSCTSSTPLCSISAKCDATIDARIEAGGVCQLCQGCQRRPPAKRKAAPQVTRVERRLDANHGLEAACRAPCTHYLLGPRWCCLR
jgi:hypothetical protein